MMKQILDEFVEKGADLEHDRWSRWQSYMFNKCKQRKDGSLIIPVELVSRWGTQILLSYSELSEEEKESDRKETRNYLPILTQSFNEILNELVVEEKSGKEQNEALENWGYNQLAREINEKIKKMRLTNK